MIRVFTGENSYALHAAVQRLSADFSGEAERYDGEELTLAQLPELMMGMTLFASARCIIIRELSANKSVWTDAVQWFERADETLDLVLIEPKLDKRTRTYKWLQAHATIKDFPLPQERELISWLEMYAHNHHVALDHAAAQYLVDYSGTDQWRLASDVEKLALSGQKPTRQLIESLIDPHPEASVFDLIDAVIAGKRAAVTEQLARVKSVEDPYKFFGLLASQLYSLAVCHSAQGMPAPAVAKALGVHPYPIQKMLPVAQRMSRQTLQRLISAVEYCDLQMKSSAAEPWLLIEVALLSTAS